jgi:signal transduction histidine kinase
MLPLPPRAGILPVLPLCLTVGFIAATRPLRTSVIAAGVAFAVLAARRDMWTVPGGQGGISPGLVVALSIAVAWLAGWTLRQNRIYSEALREQAVTAERLRIARELHDMVAHSIGVIAIQAGTGRRVIDTQPGEARDALAAIEATSRQTLTGLRRILGALRRSGPETASSPLGPAPGLADLDTLTASASGTGVCFDVRWCGQRRPLPPEVELSAFRIIQEAVTNVVRHASASHCQVIIDHRDEDLAIEVLDDGRGGSVSGTGYGIAGMRERASLLHGDLSAGPRADGGFRVAARLPVPASAR